MIFLARLQLLTCLVLYASCAQAIMVKFGTREGPIEPPPPEQPQPVAQPVRIPAPVWEERSNDKPDPNAQWRPQPVIPQPRYTHVAYNIPVQQGPQSAQQFVNAYIPVRQPIQAQPTKHYFTPTQILSSQSLPGFGIRYFVPEYLNDLVKRKNNLRPDDAYLNHIERNEIQDSSRVSAQDEQWKYEKEALRRLGVTSRPYQYKFPEYVPHQ